MGQEQKDYLSHRLFPNSFAEPFEITSPETPVYNCVAWALYDTEQWWEADADYFWKSDLPLDSKISTFIQFFEQYGFAVCDTVESEEGYEKVALFSNDNENCIHVARQLDNGLWTSKLGVSYDVTHSLFAMEDGLYGRVAIVMKQRLS